MWRECCVPFSMRRSRPCSLLWATMHRCFEMTRSMHNGRTLGKGWRAKVFLPPISKRLAMQATSLQLCRNANWYYGSSYSKNQSTSSVMSSTIGLPGGGYLLRAFDSCYLRADDFEWRVCWRIDALT